ncbi:MAG: hypothetical protein FWC62_08190 [Firmicutes bacterium]|nr:hypothetical protein [Bacillota bacterium]
MSRKGYLIGFILVVIAALVDVGLWLFGSIGVNGMFMSIIVPIILGVWLLIRYLKFDENKEQKK